MTGRWSEADWNMMRTIYWAPPSADWTNLESPRWGELGSREERYHSGHCDNTLLITDMTPSTGSNQRHGDVIITDIFSHNSKKIFLLICLGQVFCTGLWPSVFLRLVFSYVLKWNFPSSEEWIETNWVEADKEISRDSPKLSSPGRTREYMKEMIILGTSIPNLDLLML